VTFIDSTPGDGYVRSVSASRTSPITSVGRAIRHLGGEGESPNMVSPPLPNSPAAAGRPVSQTSSFSVTISAAQRAASPTTSGQ